MSKPLSIAAWVAAAVLTACQPAEDPARLWSGQTGMAVEVAGRAPIAAVHAAPPASSVHR